MSGRRGRPAPRSQFRPAPPAGFVPRLPPHDAPCENQGSGAFPQPPPGGRDPEEESGAPTSPGRFRSPERLRPEPANRPPACPLQASGVPGGSRDDPMEPLPENRPAFGAPASPAAALPTKSGTRRLGGAARSAHPPCTSRRMSWYRAHRCALSSEPPAGAGAGAEHGAPGQWALGPGGPQPGQEGEDEVARGLPWPGHGSQRRAAARSPTPAMPAARRPPAEPTARRLVRLPPTARPPRWPRAPRPDRPMGAARGARPANGRAPWAGRREAPGRGGTGSPAPFLAPDSPARLSALRPA